MSVLKDVRWAIEMFRARRLRRRLLFSRRAEFDCAVRPKIDGDNVIAYPDAIYHAERADFARAWKAAS